MEARTSWAQGRLFPSEVMEFNLRFGVIPSEDHCQWTVTLRDPLSEELVDMVSTPHSPVITLPMALSKAFDELVRMVGDHVDPF